MFTGLITASKALVRIEERQGLRTIVVALEELCEGLKRGASVAIDGVCLTATEIDTELAHVSFDVMAETLEKTSLGELEQGDLVHVERSARFGDEIGGHLVSGHVLGTARVLHVRRPDEHNVALRFELPAAAHRFVFEKGFIALKGASLTVVDHDPNLNTFEVWLIPETLAVTTFGLLEPGDRVNLEVDPQTVAIVETVERFMAASNPQIVPRH